MKIPHYMFMGGTTIQRESTLRDYHSKWVGTPALRTRWKTLSSLENCYLRHKENIVLHCWTALHNSLDKKRTPH